jgi:integrase/recombinase XerD
MSDIPSDPVGEYLAWFRDVRRRQPSSVQQYRKTLRGFEESIGTTDVLQATTADVEAFINRKRLPRSAGTNGTSTPVAALVKPAAATVQKDRTIISAFYTHAQDRLWRADNPVRLTGAPKIHNRQPKAVSDTDWMRLWVSDLSDEDRVWLGFSAFCGLRRGEIVSLSPRMVDFRKMELRNLPRKGGGEFPVEYGSLARTIAQGLPHLLPDPEGWLRLVERHAIERADELHLFSWVQHSHNEAGVNKRLVRLLVGAGLPERAWSPHAMRHTCATNLLRCGVPLHIVADQLSHRSIETTRRYLSTSGQLSRWLTGGSGGMSGGP